MGSLFGTDGVRGIPGRPPLTAAQVRRLGYVAGRLMLRRPSALRARNGEGAVAVLGRDTRASGPWLSRALARGLARAGLRVLDLGVAPTPAVAYCARSLGAACGAVVSASHNPPEFNGIKFFTGEGFKTPPELEERMEADLALAADPGEGGRGAPEAFSGGVAAYLEYLRSTFPATLDLSGLRLAVDCAHGALSGIAPGFLESLGASVFSLGCSPNGRNINRGCGALDTRALAREVRRRKAHAGVAFDGDADRAILLDERGRVLDGDAVLALCATALSRQGLLKNGKVVLTVMSNYGLIRYLESQGLSVVTVPVGDRNVTEALEAEDLSLGGESSGHIVFRRFSRTGDGLLTALQALAVKAESGLPLGRLGRLYRTMPQILRNVRAERRVPLESLPGLSRRLREAEARLKGAGRVFVRYSGTEPVLRVLVEGPKAPLIRRICNDLIAAFKKDVA